MTLQHMRVGIWVVSGKRINMHTRLDTGDKKWYFFLALWKGSEMKWIRVGRQTKEYGPFLSYKETLEEAKRVATSMTYTDEVLEHCLRFL